MLLVGFVCQLALSSQKSSSYFFAVFHLELSFDAAADDAAGFFQSLRVFEVRYVFRVVEIPGFLFVDFDGELTGPGAEHEKQRFFVRAVGERGSETFVFDAAVSFGVV